LLCLSILLDNSISSICIRLMVSYSDLYQMVKKYNISGMTCGNCVAKVKTALESIEEVEVAEVGLTSPQAIIEFSAPAELGKLKARIAEDGNYVIEEFRSAVPKETVDALPEKSFTTYKPLFLIVAFIAGVSLLAQYPFDGFSGKMWMRHFMAGFFIVFSFFKLLNLKGFANSYRMYDIVAGKWKGWGFIYPFVELGLGIAYLINFAPFVTNLTTVIVLGVSSIGVIKSNLDKREIKCACLGDVFNLPMSTVTIIEDLVMVAMAAVMLFS
jgi:copper chaperone CopZ